MRKAAKPRKTFADIKAGYTHYDPQVEGYGSPEKWNQSFYVRMGFEEAQRVVHGTKKTPRSFFDLGRDCTWQEVKSAFRREAMNCHPDRCIVNNMTKEEAERRFKELTAAYWVLAREFGED